MTEPELAPLPWHAVSSDRGAAASPVVADDDDRHLRLLGVGSSPNSRLFDAALLPNGERDELHREMYIYFKWLELSVMRSKSSTNASRAGMSLAGIRSVIAALSGGLRAVHTDGVALIRAASDQAAKGGAPFFERQYGGVLKRRMGETREVGNEGRTINTWDGICRDSLHKRTEREAPPGPDPLAAARATLAAARGTPPHEPKKMKCTSHDSEASAALKEPPKERKLPKRCRPLEPFDFDAEFKKLEQYRDENGDCNVKCDSPLYKWVYGIRQRWAQMGGSLDNPLGAKLNGETVPLSEATSAGSAEDDENSGGLLEMAPVEVVAPPGKLGLKVKFHGEKGGEQRAVVAQVAANCAFNLQINAGDRLFTIDGRAVTGPEDLVAGAEKERTVGIVPRNERPIFTPRLLTREQIDRLNSIDFPWMCIRGRPWEASFQDLLAYYKSNGDFRVPRNYLTEEKFNLGEWVHTQRSCYRRKVPSFMKHRAPRLETAGFEWKPFKTDFERNFRELVEYKRLHGDANVPFTHAKKYKYRNLSRWCAQVRYTRNRLEARMRDGTTAGGLNRIITEERIKLLDSIGFDWAGKPLKKLPKVVSSPVENNADAKNDAEDHAYENVVEETFAENAE